MKIEYNKVWNQLVLDIIFFCQTSLFYNKRINTIIKINPITSTTNPVIKNDIPVSFPLSCGVLLSVLPSTVVSVSEELKYNKTDI